MVQKLRNPSEMEKSAVMGQSYAGGTPADGSGFSIDGKSIMPLTIHPVKPCPVFQLRHPGHTYEWTTPPNCI